VIHQSRGIAAKEGDAGIKKFDRRKGALRVELLDEGENLIRSQICSSTLMKSGGRSFERSALLPSVYAFQKAFSCAMIASGVVAG